MENKNTEDRIDELEKRIKSIQTREYAIIGAILLMEFGMVVLSKRLQVLEGYQYKIAKKAYAPVSTSVVIPTEDLLTGKPSRSEAPVNVSRETVDNQTTEKAASNE